MKSFTIPVLILLTVSAHSDYSHLFNLPVVARASGNGLQIRSIPSTKGAIQGTLKKGEKVYVLKQSDNLETIEGKTGYWGLVATNRTVGWAFGGYLEAIDNENIPATPVFDKSWEYVADYGYKTFDASELATLSTTQLNHKVAELVRKNMLGYDGNANFSHFSSFSKDISFFPPLMVFLLQSDKVCPEWGGDYTLPFNSNECEFDFIQFTKLFETFSRNPIKARLAIETSLKGPGRKSLAVVTTYQILLGTCTSSLTQARVESVFAKGYSGVSLQDRSALSDLARTVPSIRHYFLKQLETDSLTRNVRRLAAEAIRSCDDDPFKSAVDAFDRVIQPELFSPYAKHFENTGFLRLGDTISYHGKAWDGLMVQEIRGPRGEVLTRNLSSGTPGVEYTIRTDGQRQALLRTELMKTGSGILVFEKQGRYLVTFNHGYQGGVNTIPLILENER